MKKILFAILVMVGLFTAAPAQAVDADRFLADLRANGFNIPEAPGPEFVAIAYGNATCVDLFNGASVDAVLADLGEVFTLKQANTMLYMSIKDICPRMKV